MYFMAKLWLFEFAIVVWATHTFTLLIHICNHNLKSIKGNHKDKKCLKANQMCHLNNEPQTRGEIKINKLNHFLNLIMSKNA